ncbi:haloacid dehalogenase [Mariannaea sp. PMI_226]|nr:haloacid dehalogenase [Mariannaea sp. PMI_226]
MARPNLLLCFDAFGTLFRPKGLVAQQYSEVARRCGLTGFSGHDLQASLRAAIKDEAKRNPNYGKATGLGATKWWTNVIHKTFTPFLKTNQALPKDLAPRLLHRFSSKEGYDAEESLASALKSLRRTNAHRRFGRIVVGVVTNSDDRVPSILSSFGIDVSPMRYGTEVDPGALVGKNYDIDFHCMSYDVGVEKPDSLMFDSAELMLTKIITMRDGKSPAEAKADIETWRKVYVGDEFVKDVVGSGNAGWNPVLLDTNNQSGSIPRLEDQHSQTIDDLFKEHAVVRVSSVNGLAKWLTGGKSAVA